MIYAILAILLIISIDVINSTVKNDAKYLTEVAYGPFVYHDEIYVFSDLSTFPSSNDTEVLDYIHRDFTDYFSIKRDFYKAAEVLPMLIGDVNDPERNYLKVREDRDQYAVKASVLEKRGTVDEIVSMFDDFVLWECKKRHYTLEELEQNGVDDPYEMQRFSYGKEHVEVLRDIYENTELRIEDFKRDNTVYLLQAGTKDMSDFLSKNFLGVYRIPEETDQGVLIMNPDFYVGIIFYESGKFYFGNYDNEIVNEAKDALLKAIEN